MTTTARGIRYRQVADRVGALIERGALRTGDRIPSLRRTSEAESVSLTTTLQAYALLESRGYIEARAQSGFYVRARHTPSVPGSVPLPSRRVACQVNVTEFATRLLEAAQDPQLVPFGAACPAPALLPTRSLARRMASLARTGGADTNTYSFPPGRLELRREIARRSLSWGGELSPDDVLITCGATEALSIALRAVSAPGDTVVVESPAYFGTLLLVETLGLKALEVRTDARTGLSVEDLAGIIERHRVAAVVASPTCHNPLGSVMPDEAKRALVALLARHDVPLIEDDVYGDAFHGLERPRPAKAWDREGRVMLCSSFSKLLAPGHRIGWIAGGRYQSALARLKLATTLATAALPQMAIAGYLRTGSYNIFLKRVRKAYRDQTERGRDAIGRAFPAGTCVTRPAGGFLLWIEMPAGVDAVQVALSALAHHISVSPGPMFSASGQYRSCLRLSCGEPWTRRHDEAIATLGKIVGSSEPFAGFLPNTRRAR